MRDKLGVFIWVCMSLWGNCLGSFVVESSLEVTSPASIVGVYDTSIGGYGVPKHGGTLVGTVVYPEANELGCINFDQFGLSFKSRLGALPIVLLLDRGGLFLLILSSIIQFWKKKHFNYIHFFLLSVCLCYINPDMNSNLIKVKMIKYFFGRCKCFSLKLFESL